MFTVKFYVYQKRDNSFAIPNDSTVTGQEFSCKLKAPCSFQNPVIILSNIVMEQLNLLRSYTYARIESFGRYYFVDEWTLNGATAIATLRVDTLASFRTQVLATNQYVLRSASAYDGFIKDTKYPVKASNPAYNGYIGMNPLAPSVNNPKGIFVLGIVNASGSITGSVSYYAITTDDCTYFMQQLFNLTTQWGDGGADFADGLKKAITDPMQYIVSAVWFPWSMQDFVNHQLVTGVTSIAVGYDTISLGGRTAGKFVDTIDVEFTNVIQINKPEHPLAASRGNYMNYEPFTRYYLCFYPFGSLIELDGTRLEGTTYLVYTVDLRNGKGILSVCNYYTGSSWADWRPERPQRVLEAQVGVNVPLATIHTVMPSSISEYVTNTITAAVSDYGGFEQTGRKLVNTASNKIMGGIAKLFGSEELSEAVSQAETQMDTFQSADVSKIASNGLAMKSTLEMIGSQGTMSFYDRMSIMLWGEFYTPVNDDVSKFGRPLCQTVTLSALSGFVLCDNPRLSISGAFQNEIATIETYLAQGAFIE